MVAGIHEGARKNYGGTPRVCRHNSLGSRGLSLLVPVASLGFAHMRYPTSCECPPFPNPPSAGTMDLRDSGRRATDCRVL